MQTVTQQPSSESGNIMIVDDSPANLKLLEEMLFQRGYGVRSFPRGRLAIAAANQEPPDLILLDITMPEMNGYEVCELLKASPRLSAIPVIFLSALDGTGDKVKGFQAGGADYISKPFQFEEVAARVETHLKLRRAQKAESDLLERTLGGTVETLWELVQLTSPVLAARSRAVRDIVIQIATKTGIEDQWQYELAATMCLVGCIAVPDDVFEGGYLGENLTADERCMFNAHPERAARLVSKIPRLELVAEMIRGQHVPDSVAQDAKQGAQMLHLALELDRRICQGIAPRTALTELKLSGKFSAGMLGALEGYCPQNVAFDLLRLPVKELRANMVLEKDVTSKDGSLLILKQGTVLTETWIERLENFAKSRVGKELVDVRVPRFTGLPKSREHDHFSETRH